MTGLFLRAPLFEDDLCETRVAVAAESATLVLRSLLTDPGRLTEIQSEAAGLIAAYRAG